MNDRLTEHEPTIYHCGICNSDFENPIIIKTRCGMTIERCPVCGSECIEEIE